MKYKIINALRLAALLPAVAISITGCKKDYTDPSRANDELSFSTARGLSAVAVGLQRVYTSGRGSTLYNLVTINGLITNELLVVNTGNTAEVLLAAGGTSVDGNNTILIQFWSSCNKTIFDADKVIDASQKLADKNYASGLIAYASIFKAMSIADMAQFWEKVPASTGANVTFIDRIDGFKKAVAVLDNAQAAIVANPINAAFTASVPAGIDIANTINALKARYSLYAGLYPQALTAANAVDITKKSVFSFDGLTLNPIFEIATATNNVVQPKNLAMGQLAPFQPAATDGRVGFYITPTVRINGFCAAAATAFPVYLPSEITLIKAECLARTNDSTTAKTFLNSVITKTIASDPFGVGAGLAPIADFGSYAALLDEIYKQRCIELFMSGHKLEDMRRFGRPNSERRRNLMPYPLRERDNNPNTPADPPF
jgi:starch-binding outer membrane protein, SusD/RagB family